MPIVVVGMGAAVPLRENKLCTVCALHLGLHSAYRCLGEVPAVETLLDINVPH
jgi:hypothetical protein